MRIARREKAGIVNGRMYGYGVTLQLMNPDPNKKLKGIELPKGQITFDVNLKAEKVAGGITTDITGTGEDQIMPLLWDYRENIASVAPGKEGRNFFWAGRSESRYAAGAAPWNLFSNPSIFAVADGGAWNAEQSDSKISVTVDAYKFLTDSSQYNWPTTDCNNSGTSVLYGEDKGIGCFSAGYFQILFPFANTDESASYYLTVSDDNMNAASLTGQTVTNTDQAKTSDDSVRNQVALSPEGGYSKQNLEFIVLKTHRKAILRPKKGKNGRSCRKIPLSGR